MRFISGISYRPGKLVLSLHKIGIGDIIRL